MPVKWTDEQQKAIDSRGKGIVVPAAAGSGKTAVLIERVVSILADPSNMITPDSLLAVTFTTDATANMKRKLGDEFEKRISQRPDDMWLRKQQSMLAGARIKTINAFCLDFVKEHFNRLSIRDDVTIIDANDADMLFDEAIDQALEEFYANSPELMRKLTDHLCDEKDTKLVEYIKSLSRVLDSIPFREYWIRDIIQEYKDGTMLKKSKEYVFKKPDELCKRYVKDIEMGRRIIKLLEDVPKAEGVSRNIESNISKLDSIVTLVNKRDNEGIYKLCKERIIFGKISSLKEEYFPSGAAFQLVSSLYDDFLKEKETFRGFKEEIFKLLAVSDKSVSESITLTGELFEGIAELTMRARELLDDKKLDKNAVSFSDVEDMTVRLLLEYDGKEYKRTDLCEEIVKSKQIKIIMIDEFQDVNDLQELIFKALSDTDDLSVMGRNVFIVGDVKQAIYGFRQTNPELLLDTIRQAGLDKNRDKLEVIRLTKNFRSRVNIIDFVNDIFSSLMSPRTGDIDYNDDEMLRLGAEYPEYEHKTDVMYFVDEGDPEDDDDSDDDKSKVRYDDYNERHIAAANYIIDMITKGVPVTENGQLRPCRASDFCILVRTNKEQVRFAKALETVGISSFYDIAGGYMDSREILVMTNLLRIIDSPRNDLSMLSVMMSPVFGFSANEVTEIKLLCKTDASGINKKLYQVMLALSKDEEEQHEKETERIITDNKDLALKCKKAVDLIKKLRFYAASMPLEALINKIYDETDLYAAAAAFENSRQMRANLRLLIEYAAAYDKSGNSGGLSGFIRYFEKIVSYGKDFSQAIVSTSDTDGVIIQTMHGSKGLEYPFVIIAGLDNKFSDADTKSRFLCDRKFGCAIKYQDAYDLTVTSSFAYEMIKDQIHCKQLSEEMRLLYVALTRAKERLCLLLPIKTNVKNDPVKKIGEKYAAISMSGEMTDKMVNDCISFLEWIFLALYSYKEFSPAVKVIADHNDTVYELPITEHNAKLNVFEADTTERSRVSSVYKPVSPDPLIVDTLEKGFLAKDKKELSKVISKLSVTEIVRNEQEKKYKDKNPEFYPQLPRLDEEIGKLTHAERGTYTHLFMELADYEKAEKSVADELARLVEKGHFTELEAQGVYINALEMFFASDFYKRMSSSGNIMREKKFLASIDELKLGKDFSEFENTDAMVQGIADSIFEEDDGYVIVDYKTDRFDNESDMDKYKTQLLIYKAAFDLILDKKVKSCYIYSFWLGKGREMIF